MAFSKSNAKILAPFIPKFKDCKNINEQKEVLRSAIEAIKTTTNNREEEEEKLLKNLNAVCFKVKKCHLLYWYLSFRPLQIIWKLSQAK